MKHFKYLIVGGGLAGDAAVRGIRELDTKGSIGMFSMELNPPYTRPNLSKGLWKGRPLEKIWKNTESLAVELFLNRKVTELDVEKKCIGDATGAEYTFDKLLLATGGSPIRLPFGGENIIYYRDLQDYRRLRALADRGEHFLVIGGGFIGSEIAAALSTNGKKVVMVFPEHAIGARVYPSSLAHFLNEYYRAKGVDVVSDDTVADIDKDGDRLTVRTARGRNFAMDGVVAGIGIRPNVELAQRSGLRTENGIVVDERLCTSVPDIYAAGDVTNFYHAALGKRIRVEHEDNAVQMGKIAGRNMAGSQESYNHTPMFYSDLFGLGYEAVGEINSEMETVEDWQEPFKQGVIYYTEKERLRGILLWNVWDRVDIARALLAEAGPFHVKQLQKQISV